MTMVNLPAQAVKAIDILQQNGFEAFAVGGCVRDGLMGQNSHDIDITTSAKPLQVAQIFKAYKIIETGLAHGTLTVIIESLPLEITTYRSEGKYTDKRRPQTVNFISDLKTDTSRRDFTINALCYSPKTGLMDFWGGEDDIKNKSIRCVGKAALRFEEDPLRILRALRFAATLDFTIEKATRAAIFKKAYLLKYISSERLYQELCKLLCGKKAGAVLLEYVQVLSFIIPPLRPMIGFKQNNPHHIYDVLTHTAVALDNTPALPCLRFAVLLHDSGKPSCYTVDEKGVGHFYRHPKVSEKLAREVMDNLKADSETKNTVCLLVLNHDTPIPPTEKGVKRALNKYGEALLRQLISIKRADNSAQNIKEYNRQEEYDLLEATLDEVLAKGACFSLKNLAVNGKDLIDLGLKEGVLVGKLLDLLLNKVIDGELENHREDLLAYAVSRLKN